MYLVGKERVLNTIIRSNYAEVGTAWGFVDYLLGFIPVGLFLWISPLVFFPFLTKKEKTDKTSKDIIYTCTCEISTLNS